MTGKTGVRVSIVIGAIGLFACAGEKAGDTTQEARNLTLPPADSLSTDLSDQPMDGEDVGTEIAESPSAQPVSPPEHVPHPAPPMLVSGTILELLAGDTLTSRHHEVGAVVRAFNASSLTDSEGNVVIPAEAVWVGTITAIAASGGGDDNGVLTIDYTEVEFEGKIIPINATQVSNEAFVKNRELGAGDAAKVGAGAVVGGIAGRLLGGDRRGTIVGAIAGAAAGAGIMAATRPEDIILPAGYTVSIRLIDDLIVADQ